MVSPAPILVLDGEQRAALAVVRSLGARHYPVHIGASVRASLAGGSRFATSETLLPDPLHDPAEFVEGVARLAQVNGCRIVLPLTDASTIAILEARARLPDLTVPCGDLQAFQRAADKQHVLELARGLGIDVPGQWLLEDGTTPLPEIGDDDFPLVLKPARSVSEGHHGRIKIGVSYANSREHLLAILARMDPRCFPILLQRRITGPGVGVFLLRWKGQTVATFAHRRIREFPPSGGVSVNCESIELDPHLGAQSMALLDRLDWTGVAMVEFKLESRTGRAYLMEVNPRFWGSLQLAVDAGADFPWYLVRLALGEAFSPSHQWRVGLRSRWEWGEVDYVLARVTKSRARLDLPEDAPGLLRVLGQAMVPWRPRQRGAVFRFGDPAPFFRESIGWFRALKGST